MRTVLQYLLALGRRLICKEHNVDEGLSYPDVALDVINSLPRIFGDASVIAASRFGGKCNSTLTTILYDGMCYFISIKLTVLCLFSVKIQNTRAF